MAINSLRETLVIAVAARTILWTDNGVLEGRHCLKPVFQTHIQCHEIIYSVTDRYLVDATKLQEEIKEVNWILSQKLHFW
jgi:hypothetical protein